MTSCAIRWCGKNSKTSNSKTDGITFHRFPTDPNLKEKWINCTKRENWFPSNYSVVCSRHFTEDCFQTLKNRRRLRETAIPTLNLPLVGTFYNATPVTIIQQQPVNAIYLPMPRPTVEQINQPTRLRQILQQSTSNNGKNQTMPPLDTPFVLQLHRKLTDAEEIIKKQRLKIKSLKKLNSQRVKRIHALVTLLKRYKPKSDTTVLPDTDIAVDLDTDTTVKPVTDHDYVVKMEPDTDTAFIPDTDYEVKIEPGTDTVVEPDTDYVVKMKPDTDISVKIEPLEIEYDSSATQPCFL